MVKGGDTMRRNMTLGLAATALGLALAGMAVADPVEDTLVVETDDGPLEMITSTAAPII
jgi:L-cysteine S-thiosulfotransferase